MSNLLQVQNGTKNMGPKLLFEEVTFAINSGEHVGVIGPNGAGKTTLFKILTQTENLDEGRLVLANGLRMGYLAQHDNWDSSLTLEDYLQQGCLLPIWELKKWAYGLGLTDDHFNQTIASMSGGYRMRCKLLHLLGEDPDILLLDEPTNYLDLESVLVLEHFLQSFSGAFLLISHDREFLRRTTDHILEVELGNVVKFNGGLDDYFEQKQMLQEQLQAKAMNLAEKRKQILDFVNKFGAKATKAKQAQSRLKSLNKMESIEIKSLPTTAKIKIPSPTRTGKKILTVEDANLGYQDKVVLKNVNMEVLRGDHIGVVGVNGAGKSTLLKALSAYLKPLTGRVEHGMNVDIGFYAQHVTEALEPKDTVIEALRRKAHPDIVPENILNIAGSLLFQGEDIHKKIKVLSGGEKSRVALGQILLQKAPCLILDEPTNHLDFQTVEALTMALNDFDGTVIIVSHDRSFVQRVSKKIIKIEDGTAELFPGDYNEYVWSLQKGMLSGYSKKSSESSSKDSVRVLKGTNKGQNFKELKKEIKELEKQQKKIERTIAELDQQTIEINKKLSAEASDSELLAKELGALQIQKDEFENKWLEIVDLVESKKDQL